MPVTIAEYKQQLKGLPKEEKISIIKQEITNRALFASIPPGLAKKKIVEQIPTNAELENLQSEIENNVEAYESVTKRKELIPFMHDRDLNWYYNKKNFPAWERLLLPTVNFIENERKGLFETVDFLNLVNWHYEELQSQFEKPFDFIAHIQKLPLKKEENHLLLAVLLKWYGGLPVADEHNNLFIIRKLVEKEFLNQYPNEKTLEVLFCNTDERSKKQFGEIATHLQAAMPGIKVINPNEPDLQSKYDFPESHYIDKIDFDFEDLPNYVIQKSIIWKFEDRKLNEEGYSEWRNSLVEFLNSIPNEYVLKALSKGIEYGKRVYKYHIDNDCTKPLNCGFNECWERRIVIAEKLLVQLSPPEESKMEVSINQFMLNEKVISKIDFIRIINTLCELKAFRNEDGQIPYKKEVIEALGKFVGLDLKNFHPDLNKALEKSEQANIQIFETLKTKASDIWNNKNYK
jgi:hypothetical protein